MSSGGLAVKAQVVDHPPKRFKELKFGIQSNQDIVNQAVLEVTDRVPWGINKDEGPNPNGPLDKRMGVGSKGVVCDTCGEPMETCTGHFGHVRLALPAFHIGYLKLTIAILQQICKVRTNHSRRERSIASNCLFRIVEEFSWWRANDAAF